MYCALYWNILRTLLQHTKETQFRGLLKKAKNQPSACPTFHRFAQLYTLQNIEKLNIFLSLYIIILDSEVPTATLTTLHLLHFSRDVSGVPEYWQYNNIWNPLWEKNFLYHFIRHRCVSNFYSPSLVFCVHVAHHDIVSIGMYHITKGNHRYKHEHKCGH